MSRDNIGWGAPRIYGELRMLGIQVSQATVAKYMIRHRKPPSQTWKAFLNNHARDMVSIACFKTPSMGKKSQNKDGRVDSPVWFFGDEIHRFTGTPGSFPGDFTPFK
jgi:hypothetical protein